jgi:hypothetical protein
MADKNQRDETDAQIPENEAPDQPAAPANQRHSDQGKLQNTYEAQKTEGMVRGEDRVPRDED